MSKNKKKGVINNGPRGVKKIPAVKQFNGKPILSKTGEIHLFCQTLPDGDLYIKHYRDNEGYKTLWYLKNEEDIRNSRIVSSTKSLAVENKKRDKSISDRAKDTFKVDVKDHLKKVGEYISTNEFSIFPSKNKTLERSKKDTQLIKIAKALEYKNKIVINKVTGELHIYNPLKGVYEAYNNKEFSAFLSEKYRDKFLMDEVTKIMGTFTDIKEESKTYIAFNNCLLNMDTLETEDFNENEFVCFQVPFNWDPEASSEFFETKIREILVDDQTYLLFLQMLGYCFTHSNPYHKMFFITGDGANGKSTLMAIIRSIFHSSVAAVDLQQFKNDFGLQPLLGKKINILPDLPYHTITDTGHIKAVTGEDLITVNRKHKEAVNTTLGSKIIGIGNQLPPVNDDTFAFWRRVIIIELTNKFNDPTIKDKLLTDVKGIEGLIYQSINAFKRVKSEGWAIKMSKGDIRRQYLLLSDPCLYAAEELFEKTNDPQDYVTRSDVVHLISEYLKSQDIDAPGNVKLYYTAIRSIGGDDSDRRIDGVKNRGFTFVKTKQVLEQQSDKELKNLAFWGNEEAQAELDYRKLNEIGEHSDES